jgi:orotidine-5'-phosphate decarboxylase
MTYSIEPPAAVALDVPDMDGARRLLDALAGMVPVFKVGLELFTAEGPAAVREVQERGAEVFLDLKCNDIPKTVAGAVRSAGRLGARYLTVHSNAGRAVIRAAVDEAGGRGVHILVVSVLTSLGDEELAELGVGRGAADQVDAMARLAAEEGAYGLVLGAGEAARVRAGQPDLFLVTPGIRPATLDGDDQRRTGTPAAAIRAGADMLVLARAACDVPDPRAALQAILAEIDGARAGAAT